MSEKSADGGAKHMRRETSREKICGEGGGACGKKIGGAGAEAEPAAALEGVRRAKGGEY